MTKKNLLLVAVGFVAGLILGVVCVLLCKYPSIIQSMIVGVMVAETGALIEHWFDD